MSSPMRRLGALLLVVSTACAAPAPPDGPPADVQVPLETSVLENGLTVAVSPNHSAPVVTALLAVRAHDEPATLGHAHLLEHMLLSSDAPAGGTLASGLDALGASYNGFTSTDSVRYPLTVARANLDGALALLASVVQRPSFVESVLAREKQVVLSEQDLNASRPDAQLQRRLLAELYGDDASAWDALGTRESVLGATADALRAAHARDYVPERALLVLSGDITSDEAIGLARTHFGGWARASGGSASVARPAPRPAVNRSVRVNGEAHTAQILVAWEGPSGGSDPEVEIASDLLAALTFDTLHSFRELVGRPLASSASLNLYRGCDAGYFQVALAAAPANLRLVLDRLRTVMARIGTGDDVTEAQLAAAKDRLYGRYLLDSTDPSRRPERIAAFWSCTSVDDYEQYLDRLYAVDRDDLARIAERYLRGTPNAIVIMAHPADAIALDHWGGW